MCDSGISLNSSVSSDDRDLSDKIVTEDSSECSDKESEVKMSLSRWPSLASTISSSSVSVTDVRTLTDKYQRMLMQATQEIKNLNLVKTSLEMEQEKLLKVNIEIATEAKRLVRENKAWKEERKVGLVAITSNSSFSWGTESQLLSLWALKRNHILNSYKNHIPNLHKNPSRIHLRTISRTHISTTSQIYIRPYPKLI